MKSTFIVLILCLVFKVQSQNTNEVAAVKLRSLYIQNMKENLLLYNGSEPDDYGFRNIGIPYFQSEIPQTGNVFYDGILYDSVPLLYDLVKDDIITTHHNNAYKILLRKEKVKWFKISGHLFQHVKPDTNKKLDLPEGFYDLIYDKNYKVYVKRKVNIQEVKSSHRITKEFVPENQYYLLADKTYNINSKSGILKPFKDHKKELSALLKDKNMSYKKDKEKAITLILEYMNGIK